MVNEKRRVATCWVPGRHAERVVAITPDVPPSRASVPVATKMQNSEGHRSVRVNDPRPKRAFHWDERPSSIISYEVTPSGTPVGEGGALGGREERGGGTSHGQL